MQTLKQWLESCDAFDVRPCRITIAKASYEACAYRQTFKVIESSAAYARGEREYVREMIYCLGSKPAAYRRSSKTCFRFIGDSRDWYVTGYCPKEVAADSRYADFHPFGELFQLAPWSVPDGTAIDHYEPKPYKRIGASVDYRVDAYAFRVA